MLDHAGEGLGPGVGEPGRDRLVRPHRRFPHPDAEHLAADPDDPPADDEVGGDHQHGRRARAQEWRSKSTAEYARNFPSWCMESMIRMVPDLDRMTIEAV